MTSRPSAVGEETFARLKKHWNEQQIVEITAVAGLFNYFNRFNAALDMDLTVYPRSLE